MSRIARRSENVVKTAILVLSSTGLTTGLWFYFTEDPALADLFWVAGVVPALAALSIEILRGIGRGEVGLDIVARVRRRETRFPASAPAGAGRA